MTGAQDRGPSVIEWGAAGSPFEGDQSGDLHVVVELPHGALVALLDGLGHGAEAAAAARTAARILEAHAGDPVLALVKRCHEDLRRTRGVVMSLACFSTRDSSVTWLGVGNVEGELRRADPNAIPRREVIALRGGVVGYQLPPLRARTLPVSPGDMLIMATDGIRTGFAAGVIMERSPQQIAESILAKHAKGSDDALVVVARYLGEASGPTIVRSHA